MRLEWRPVSEDALSGVFFHCYRYHILFFRELSSGDIGVISILHANMYIPARLREDVERQQEL